MNKKIKTGLAGILTAGALFLGCSQNREPFELKDVAHGGNSYVGRPDVVCAFYDSNGERFPVVNRDRSFDQSEAYDANGPRFQGRYDVSGYKTSGLFGGTYATNIVGVSSKN